MSFLFRKIPLNRTLLGHPALVASLALIAAFSLTACGGSSPSDDDIVVEDAPAQTPQAVTAQSVPPGIAWRGVSFSGAEYNSSALPGTYGTQYYYPQLSATDYFQAKGMNLVRLPFLWERLQPTLNGNLDQPELQRLKEFVNGATAKGMTVLLDPHGYGRYRKQLIGSTAVPLSAFGNFWSRVATVFKGNPKVVFGLMNEPYGGTTETWVAAANEAIRRIRAAGAPNAIIAPGNAWSGANSWSASWYGTPNATAMLQLSDSAHNTLIEVHQYLDADSSGTTANCVSATIGAERLAGFTAWLRANGKRGFLGEFAAADTPVCQAALAGMLSHMTANADVWAGWSYWLAGPWAANDAFSIEPQKGVDRPQMATLQPYLP